MNTSVECYPCMLRQALSICRLVGMDESRTKQVADSTMRLLIDSHLSLSPPEIGREIQALACAAVGQTPDSFDPYRDLKESTNRTALGYLDTLRELVSSSPDPFAAAVKVAAAGNIIDFGAKDHASVDIDDEVAAIPSLTFAVDDTAALRQQLAAAHRLLYVGDNAGEVVFDRVLLEHMREEFPDLQMVFATRERPVINDATLHDAHEAGLDQVARLMSSGSIYPATMLERTSDEFRAEFDHADVIIAKGQGNFEGLCDIRDRRLFLILRVKCDRVARDVGTEVGKLVVLRNGD